MSESKAPETNWTPREIAMFGCGVILFLAGLAIVYVARHKGIDDYKYQYALSKMLMSGHNAYRIADYSAIELPWGLDYQPYPPSIGIILAPLALLPYNFALAGWTFLVASVFLVGMWALLRYIAGHQRPGLIMLLVGACMCTASFRHGLTSVQVAPLQVGLFGLFLVALDRKNGPAIFVLSLLALCLKFTNALPFLALLVLRRHYTTLVSVIVLFIAINLAGFLRMGGLQILSEYQTNLKIVERLPVNHPDPYLFGSLIRLDWEFLLNLFHIGLRNAAIVSKLLVLVSLGWLVLEARRAGIRPDTWEKTALFAVPLTCIGILSVYHHHYEAIAFVPLLLIYAFASEPIRSSAAVRVFAVSVLPFILLYSVPQVVSIGDKFGPTAAALYKCVGAIVATIALICSLIVLRRYINESDLSTGAQPRGAAG